MSSSDPRAARTVRHARSGPGGSYNFQSRSPDVTTDGRILPLTLQPTTAAAVGTGTGSKLEQLWLLSLQLMSAARLKLGQRLLAGCWAIFPIKIMY